MTAEQKKAKILAAAASFGAHCDLYLDVASAMAIDGLIVQRATKTAVGNTVYRWFLTA